MINSVLDEIKIIWSPGKLIFCYLIIDEKVKFKYVWFNCLSSVEHRTSPKQNMTVDMYAIYSSNKFLCIYLFVSYFFSLLVSFLNCFISNYSSLIAFNAIKFRSTWLSVRIISRCYVFPNFARWLWMQFCVRYPISRSLIVICVQLGRALDAMRWSRRCYRLRYGKLYLQNIHSMHKEETYGTLLLQPVWKDLHVTINMQVVRCLEFDALLPIQYLASLN